MKIVDLRFWRRSWSSLCLSSAITTSYSSTAHQASRSSSARVSQGEPGVMRPPPDLGCDGVPPVAYVRIRLHTSAYVRIRSAAHAAR